MTKVGKQGSFFPRQRLGYLAKVGSLALFLFWWQSVFRVVPTISVAVPFILYQSERRDEGWLAFMAVLAFISAVSFIYSTSIRKSPPQMKAVSFVVGSFLMSLGSVLVLYLPNQVLPVIIGGVLAGAGTSQLIIQLFRLLSMQTKRELLVLAVFSCLTLSLFTTLLFFLPMTVTLVFICLCPVCVALLIMFSFAHIKVPSVHSVEDVIDVTVQRSRFRRNLTTCLFIFFFTYLYACITGFRMDSFRPEQYFDYNLTLMIASSLYVVAILLVLVKSLGEELLPFACLLMVATALLLLPSAAENLNGYFLANSLNTACGFISFILAAITISTYDSKNGDPLPFRWRQACITVLFIALISLFSAFLGGLIYNNLGLDSGAIAIVAVIVLYMIFLVSGLLFQKRERVEYVLTGRFESEADLADCRSRILVLRYPDLTSREVEVLSLLLRGRNATGIAEILVVSENTAKSHIQHIYKKLHIRSRQELLKLAESIPHEKEQTGG